jgi:hypothetical protein
MDDLPFLAIESDGSPFPQLIDAKLEAFCLRAKRLHDRMLKERKGHIHLDRTEKQDTYNKKPLQVSSAYMH